MIDPNELPPPLPYLAPRDDDDARARETARKVTGAILTTGAVLGLTFVWILSNLRLHTGSPGPPPAPFEYKVPGTLTALAPFTEDWVFNAHILFSRLACEARPPDTLCAFNT